MRLSKLSIIFVLCIIIISCTSEPKLIPKLKYKPYLPKKIIYKLEHSKPVNRLNLFSSDGYPKNIIFMIGDGMSLGNIFASNIANRGNLYLNQFKNIGFISTHSFNYHITDSAAAATAFASGVKTLNGAIGVDRTRKKLETLVDIALKKGKSIGIIATSSIAHATPAAFYAHQPSRRMYKKIAKDLLAEDIDFIAGGGKKYFSSEYLDQFIKKGYQVVTQNISQVNPESKKHLILLAENGFKTVTEGRGDLFQKLILLGINSLNSNPNGFFLVIEGSQIDWGGHQQDIQYMVTELLDFDQGVGKALAFASRQKDTLLLVTADHDTAGFTTTSANVLIGGIEGQFVNNIHTPIWVPVFSFGPKSNRFTGFYDNTDIFFKLKEIMNY